jgi:hypothetical protein
MNIFIEEMIQQNIIDFVTLQDFIEDKGLPDYSKETVFLYANNMNAYYNPLRLSTENVA